MRTALLSLRNEERGLEEQTNEVLRVDGHHALDGGSPLGQVGFQALASANLVPPIG